MIWSRIQKVKNLNFCSKCPLKFLLFFHIIEIQRVAYNGVNPVECCTLFVFVANLFYGGADIVKRIKAACICQTIHFMLKEDVGHDYAVKLVKEEVEQYKKKLDRNQTKYRIVEEASQPDGSVMVKIIKQYNQSPVGDYLNEA